MTSNSASNSKTDIERKQTTLITSDMVIDTYLAMKKEKNKTKKQEMMNNVIFMSNHLNRYIPLKRSQYIEK
jgi:hypothetical protein